MKRLNPDGGNFAVLHGWDTRSIHADVKSLIDNLGAASSRAQGLGHAITSFSAFSGSDNTLYILLDDEHSRAVGFVKIGRRNLFLWDRYGVQHEMNTVCLLDFFTHPSCQRKGYGKAMIDRMLKDQGLEMRQIPIDRPSDLCLSFMKSRFGLQSFMPQANKFVAFDDFFDPKELPRLDPYGRVTQKSVVPQSSGYDGPSLETHGRFQRGYIGQGVIRAKPAVIAPVLQGRTASRRPPQRYNPITWNAMD